MRIASIDLLCELERPEYAGLKQCFVSRTHSKGTLVFSPCQDVDSVFVIAEGRLRIYLASDNKEFTLAILEPGAVYTTHTRAFVEALEDCTLLLTDTRTFHRQLSLHPELTGALINVLGGLLKNSFSIISGLAFEDANRRLVQFLLREARESGEHGDDGRSALIRLGLTTEELATVVGSSRQTVSLLINDLVRSHELEKVERGVYLVPDLAQLEAHLL